MKKLALLAALVALASPALAHTGHGDANGFWHGLMHPVGGADHLLAMLAVGIWSGFVMPQRLWLGALAFLSAMIAGAGLSWAGVGLPMVETGIVASVVVFGLIILLAKTGQAGWISAASFAAIAFFAAFHGHAHATEATGAVALYLGGFLMSTAALHLAGIALARATARWQAADVAQKVLGGAVAASGLYLMVG
ncbi:MAG: HupE/UreJ family protein [Paracoccaceae bacterium]|nr:HupE/UreJ family protein [Paracoccaceae bacterium]